MSTKVSSIALEKNGIGRERTLEEGNGTRLGRTDATLEEFRLEEAGGERDLSGRERVVRVVGHVVEV